MMTKRVLALLLAIGMILCMVACNKTGTTDSTTTQGGNTDTTTTTQGDDTTSTQDGDNTTTQDGNVNNTTTQNGNVNNTTTQDGNVNNTTTTNNGNGGSNDSVVMKGNLAIGHKYQFSYPGLNGFSGDVNGTVLTDGVVNKDDVGGDGWLKATIKSDYYEMKSGDTFIEIPTYSVVRDPGYTISLDLGYVCDVQNVVVSFGVNTGKRLSAPKSVEVYLSNDGYNFTMYPAQTAKTAKDGGVHTYTISFNAVQKAKAVKLMVYTNTGATTAISELQVNGTRSQVKKLLSNGSKYTLDANLSEDYPDTNGKLTDGKIGSLTEMTDYVGMTVSKKDDRTGEYCATVTMDLGSNRNVSEVEMEALYKAGLCWEPQFIAAYYSEDGKTYKDFGTAAVTSVYGTKADLCKSLFTVTRNHTVKARYVKIKIYGMSDLMIDELRVYGCDNAVAEPSYNHVTKSETLVHTNVAELKEATIDGRASAILTDMIYTNDELVVNKKTGKTIIEIPFGKTWSKVNGIALYFRTNNGAKLPSTIKMHLVNGSTNTEVKAEMVTSETAGSTVARWLFNDTKASGIKLELDSKSAYTLAEVSVYNAQSQLPTIDGGFINPNFQNSVGGEGISHLDDYMWYILLKGMKDLGMDRVVFPYTTNKRLMTTLIQNDAALTKAGYKSLRLHSSQDVIEAVLNAADKLNMKVFMGTVLGVGYPHITGDVRKYHDGIIADAKLTMKALQDKYGKHKSFYAFYFSDETCDAWLNAGGVDDFRYLYKSQSDYARSIAPEKKTMICPAIWRSGAPEDGADSIYNVIRPEQEGGRPIVDIVAQQDCLGRPTDLVLTDSTFQSFEQYIEAWARSVRAAGAEFWSDLEAFNGYYVAKNIPDLISGLEIESKYSGGNIIFDIVNYFSPICQVGRVDNNYRGIYNWEYTQQDYSLMQYVKYYQTRYAAADRQGVSASKSDAPAVTLPLPSGSTANLKPPAVKPPVSGGSPLSGSGIIKTSTVPSMGYKIAANQWGAFQKFKDSNVEYAMVYDNDYLYLAFKTNDTTPVTGSMANWASAKADMIQIFMTGKGESVNDVAGLTSLDHSLRMSFVRTSADTFKGQVNAKGLATIGKGIYCEAVTNGNSSEVIIAISWEYGLGMKAPKTGDQVGLKMIYYDVKEDGSKKNTSNAGDLGPSVGGNALYTVG